MSREVIKPLYVTACVQELHRGYGPMALQRENGHLLLVGENSDNNSHLRHAIHVLPVYYSLQSLSKDG